MIQYGTGDRYGAQPERGELSTWGGIVSARLSDLAGALDGAPEAVLSAVEREGIEPMMDTATAKGRSRSNEERPTKPELRCLAFTVENFRQLAAAVGAAKALDRQNQDAAAVGAEG